MTEIFENIRGIYDFMTPSEPLRPFIDFFSESSRERTACLTSEPFTVEMFPSWTPTFWINLGTPYRVSMGPGYLQIGPGQDILVLRDATSVRYNHPADHIFTVKFFPGGLESILGINQTSFIGRVVSLRDILPDRLLRDLRAAPAGSQRVSLLENFFLASITHRRGKDHYARLVRDSIGHFEDGNMAPNTAQVAERQFLHSKAINRYFHRVIGLPPKKYFSLLRARAALTAYLAGRTGFSPEVWGYYDRSHFYKAMRQFTGRRLAGLS